MSDETSSGDVSYKNLIEIAFVIGSLLATMIAK